MSAAPGPGAVSGGLLVASERYGSGSGGGELWSYRLEEAHIRRRRAEPGTGTGTGTRLLRLVKGVFLPQGFPDSVSGDYIQYQLWDTAQAFCSSLSGTLATQASLRGVGVGKQEATVAAATTTWLLRDGAGMLGRIVFAWRRGTKLDCEAKSWRLFADVLNDVAMLMEISAQFFPAHFLWVVCTAGVFKSIVGVAGGATRAALTVHQARRHNMADISAKDGSQETLVNLAGLVVSLLLIPLVTDDPQLTLLLFSLFTVLHLVCNYKAVRSVVMETFNEARLDVVWQHFVRSGEILTPRDANEKEPVFNWFGGPGALRLGVQLQELVHSLDELHRLRRTQRHFLLGARHGCVCVCLLLGASVTDELEAMCQALSLRKLLKEKKDDNLHHSHWDLVDESEVLLEKHFQWFMNSLGESGWDTRRNLFDWDEWRIEFKWKSS